MQQLKRESVMDTGVCGESFEFVEQVFVEVFVERGCGSRCLRRDAAICGAASISQPSRFGV
jgi:hypothetical protein